MERPGAVPSALSVLVVDDEVAHVRRGLARMLRPWKVETSESGLLALGDLARRKYTGLVADGVQPSSSWADSTRRPMRRAAKSQELEADSQQLTANHRHSRFFRTSGGRGVWLKSKASMRSLAWPSWAAGSSVDSAGAPKTFSMKRGMLACSETSLKM